MNYHAKGNEKFLTKRIRRQSGNWYMTSHAKGSGKLLDKSLRGKVEGVYDFPLQKPKETCKIQAKEWHILVLKAYNT